MPKGVYIRGPKTLHRGDFKPGHIPWNKRERSSQGYGYCCKCGCELNLENASPSVVKRKRGLCKKCRQQYHQDHKERETAYKKQYYLNNKNYFQAYGKQWHEEHKEEANAKSKDWRKNHPERRLVTFRQWHQNNPLKGAEYHARYAAQKINSKGNCTAAKWQTIWDVYSGLCYMCLRPATDMEHVKPLSKGGSNWPLNLLPACDHCNSVKGSKWPFNFREHREEEGYYKRKNGVKN